MKKGISGENKMKMISELNGQFYEAEDCCFFRNPTQSAYYRHWGCELVDLFVDSNMKWVYVFRKSDHEWAKLKWAENKDKNNG